jgi:hypothetical protein
MKGFFLHRSWREKGLLLAFAALTLLIWAGQLAGRGRNRWDDGWRLRTEQATQLLWLQNRASIEAKAAMAMKSLEPGKTLNAARLVGELNTLAAKIGSAADITAQRTEDSDQFAFHAVQVNFRRTDLAALLRFYTELSQRSPYLGLEQCVIVADRANPAQLNASFRVVSVELKR